MAHQKGAGRSYLADVVLAKLAPDDFKRLKKTRWLDRLTSLWAPISIFGIAFTIYLVIVEFWVCGYPPLQPVLQGFGLVMLAFYFALVGMRVVARRFINDRKGRNVIEELISDVEALVSKHEKAIGPKPIDDLGDKVASALKALGTRDPKAVKDATGALSEAADKHLKKFKRGSSADFASGFVKALLVALLIRTVLVEPFKIPSGSMIPTLEIGDQIFVNKFIYGVRVPFLDRVPFQIVRPPQRGDVIVFYNRLVGKDFIKRIVAVPGDELQIEGTRIVVNGNEVVSVPETADYKHWEQQPCEPTPFEGKFYTTCLPDWFKSDGQFPWYEQHGELKRETIDGVPHYILNRMGGKSATVNEKVPPRSVFVMGDNRDNSEDSRFGLGGPQRVAFVPFDDIKGKATVVWLSLSHDGLFSSIFGGTGIRGDRFFRSVTMCGNEPVRH